MFFKALLVQALVLAALPEGLMAQGYKAVIVGGGAAGLHAAYTLAEKNITNIVVLEAQDRLGGRINSMPINGDWIELGAQWIHGRGKNPLWQFVSKTKIPIAAVPSRAGEGVFIRDDGKVVPSKIVTDLSTFWSFGDSSCTGQAGKSIGDVLDSDFEKWLKTKTGTAEETAWRRQMFKFYLKFQRFDTACVDLHTQSLNSWCEYDEMLPDTSFQNGYQSLINVWSSFLTQKKVPVFTKSVVNKISWKNANGKVVVSTADGRSFEADYVIVTASLGYLQRYQSSLFVPSLPASKVETINTLKMGTVNKIFLEFEKPFWDLTNPGLMFLHTGDELSTFKANASDWLREVIGFDAVKNQPNMLIGWMSGPAAKLIETLSDSTIASGLTGYLTDIVRKWKQNPTFVLPALKRIIVTRWLSNPYILGSYSYRELDSDSLDIWHSDLATPVTVNSVPKILFAGEATNDAYYSAVHGAVASGAKEAQRIISRK